ncbi:MAG: hypothetical protein WBN70_13865, partial [Polyangiales bacterium]
MLGNPSTTRPAACIVLLLVASALTSAEPLRLSLHPYAAPAEVEANAGPKRRSDDQGSERAL